MNPLTRPMFRLGGAPSADGVGITSGMRRTGFQKPIDATAGNQEIIEGLQEEIMTQEPLDLLMKKSSKEATKKKL